MNGKKRILAMVLAMMMLAALMLSGCSSEPQQSEQPQQSGQSGTGEEKPAEKPAEKTRVRVQWIGDFKMEDSTDAISGQTNKGLSVLEEAFEKEHADIDVEFILMGWDDYQKKTQTMIMAKEADVYQLPGIASIADQGLLEPLQPYIDRDSFDLGVYIDGQIDGWKVVGPDDSEPQIYGLPMIGDTRFIMYDKQIFDEWGVEYLSERPTPEEIMEKAKLMTGTNPVTGEQNYGAFYNGKKATDIVMNLNEAFGGTWGTGWRAKDLKLNFNSDTMKQALQWLVDLDKLCPEGAMSNQGGELFGTADNNIAMHIRVAPLDLNNVNALGLGERYGTSILFVNEAYGMGGMFNGSPIGISAACDVKDAAWEWLKFTASDAFTEFFWENQRYEGLPASKAVLGFDEVKNDENIQRMFESVECLWAPRYVYRVGQPESALMTGIQDVVLNGKEVAATLDAVQKESEDWIAQQ